MKGSRLCQFAFVLFALNGCNAAINGAKSFVYKTEDFQKHLGGNATLSMTHDCLEECISSEACTGVFLGSRGTERDGECYVSTREDINTVAIPNNMRFFERIHGHSCYIHEKILEDQVNMPQHLKEIFASGNCRCVTNKENLQVHFGCSFAETAHESDEDPVLIMPSGVESLDLSGIPLPEVSSFTSLNFPNGKEIKLSNCSIEKLHVGAFSWMPALQKLDLSNNNIQSLTDLNLGTQSSIFGQVNSITTLNLCGNPFEEVPAAFKKELSLPSLASLQLSSADMVSPNLRRIGINAFEGLHEVLLTGSPSVCQHLHLENSLECMCSDGLGPGYEKDSDSYGCLQIAEPPVAPVLTSLVMEVVEVTPVMPSENKTQEMVVRLNFTVPVPDTKDVELGWSLRLKMCQSQFVRLHRVTGEPYCISGFEYTQQLCCDMTLNETCNDDTPGLHLSEEFCELQGGSASVLLYPGGKFQAWLESKNAAMIWVASNTTKEFVVGASTSLLEVKSESSTESKDNSAEATLTALCVVLGLLLLLTLCLLGLSYFKYRAITSGKDSARPLQFTKTSFSKTLTAAETLDQESCTDDKDRMEGEQMEDKII
eukprot:m.180746 g.180746  ORF g.180746 m.180746 type:complete len:598 (+) comp15502_c0_seq2:197-1990(+)